MSNLGCVFEHDDERPALIDLGGATSHSFAELQQQANGIAASLDVPRGTRVGILARNSAAYVAALLGIMRAGAVAVPMNYRFPDTTLAHVVEDSELAFVFADEANRNRLPAGLPVRNFDCPAVRTFAATEPAPDEAGLVLYTSGSTGKPKGVELSHASQLSMAEVMASRLKGLTALIAAPLYHMNGMLMLFMYLRAGSRVVLMPQFDARAYLQAIADHQVNVITGVPTMLALLLRENDLIGSLDLSSVVGISIGSAPLSETVAARAREVFAGASITNGYGTTEAGALMFGPHPDGLPTPAVALGYPQPHVQVRLVGGDNPSEGVLEVQTPAAMNRYLNAPEKTAEKTTADGWINTGDTMRVDADGFYYFVGRDDDMFNCNGENVFPGEVERVLEADSRIIESCVVPRADEVRGHVPVAFVVPAPDASLTEQAVKDIALASAPAYMHPRHVLFLDEMPLAGTNKIDRAQLTERAAEVERT